MIISAECDRANDIYYDPSTGKYEKGFEHLEETPRSNYETDEGITIYAKTLVVFHDDLKNFLKNEWPSLKQFKISVKKTAHGENQKEIGSLLKMIIGMATKFYDYNPNDKKSRVTQEIVDDVAALGLNIDADTVRKWLKESVQLVDQDLFVSS